MFESSATRQRRPSLLCMWSQGRCLPLNSENSLALAAGASGRPGLTAMKTVPAGLLAIGSSSGTASGPSPQQLRLACFGQGDAALATQGEEGVPVPRAATGASTAHGGPAACTPQGRGGRASGGSSCALCRRGGGGGGSLALGVGIRVRIRVGYRGLRRSAGTGGMRDRGCDRYGRRSGDRGRGSIGCRGGSSRGRRGRGGRGLALAGWLVRAGRLRHWPWCRCGGRRCGVAGSGRRGRCLCRGSDGRRCSCCEYGCRDGSLRGRGRGGGRGWG